MDVFLKVTAGVLLTVIVSLILAKQGKEFSVLLIILVSTMVLAVAVAFFDKIFTFLSTLEQIGNLNGELLSILFKTVGIGLLSEIAVMICTDSGNHALGKSLQMLSSVIILWLCIPMFTKLIDLVENILQAV